MRMKKFGKLVIFGLCIFIIIKIVSIIVIVFIDNKYLISNTDDTDAKNQEFYMSNVKDIIQYNMGDVINLLNDIGEKVELNFKDITYNNKEILNIEFPEYNSNRDYMLSYSINDKKEEIQILKNIESINLELEEGKNTIYIEVIKDNYKIFEKNVEIYFIEPYKKQFADELINSGTQVHYRDGTMEKFDKSFELLKNSGVKLVRIDFLWQSIYKNNEYDFSKYDEYLEKISEKGIQILAILNGFGNLAGSDKKINTQEEIESFCEFAKQVIERYPTIKKVEVLNEVNMVSSYKGAYLKKEEASWYVTLMKNLKDLDKNIEWISAGTATPTQDYADKNEKIITSEEFYRNLFDNGFHKYNSNYAIHPYCNNANNNTFFYQTLNSHKKLYNDIGGFCYSNITEYGYSNYNNQENRQEIQAQKLVQQSAILDKYSNRRIKDTV